MTETSDEHDVSLHDLEPAVARMRADVLAGLRASPRHLPSQYLYDARGARLFEAICELPEYYLTRTETAIFEAHMETIAAAIGPGALLVEPGSGAGDKSELLLGGLDTPAGFVPIDISREQLVELARRVAARFPEIVVVPVCADFSSGVLTVPPEAPDGRRVAFLPGSTIGNFEPEAAVRVLRDLRLLAGEGGCVLIGADLRKDPAVLEAAYDDARGVSREFALNYLHRLNRELGADFDLQGFGYEAPYDARHGRIEMALTSLRGQVVRIGDEELAFAAGERIRTEYSYKYDLEQFRDLAGRAGLEVERVWTDPARWFSVQLCVPAPGASG